eukprot:Filipodium_phascolosomae@DN1864_c0_g1_i1.p1
MGTRLRMMEQRGVVEQLVVAIAHQLKATSRYETKVHTHNCFSFQLAPLARSINTAVKLKKCCSGRYVFSTSPMGHQTCGSRSMEPGHPRSSSKESPSQSKGGHTRISPPSQIDEPEAHYLEH